MARFDEAIEYVLSNECTEENHYSVTRGDRGGETNWGISSVFFNSLPDSEPLKRKTLKEWTKEDAISVYSKYLWESSPCNQIIDSKLSIKLFDCIVNIGQKRACELLQKAANRILILNEDDQLVEDGILGSISIKQINHENPTVLLSDYCTEILNFYGEIIRNDPSQEKFFHDWTKRAVRIPE